MADSVRQRLIDAVKTRFKTISVANGYQTDIGSNVFVWRNLERDPLNENESQLLNISDWKEINEPKISGRSDHHKTLFLHIEAECVVAVTEADSVGRKIIADIEKCLGVDIKWATTPGDITKALAFNTLPVDTNEGTNLLEVEQRDRVIVSVKYQVKIEYRNPRWDPFTASN
jgi:hypothetical protein